MEEFYKKIADIKELNARIKELEKQREELYKPQLRDFSKLPIIYTICHTQLEGVAKSDIRRIFLFVILYLYCPFRLFGGKLPKQMRNTLCYMTSVNKGVISEDCSCLLFLCSNKPFALKLTKVMLKVKEELLLS